MFPLRSRIPFLKMCTTVVQSRNRNGLWALNPGLCLSSISQPTVSTTKHLQLSTRNEAACGKYLLHSMVSPTGTHAFLFQVSKSFQTFLKLLNTITSCGKLRNVANLPRQRSWSQGPLCRWPWNELNHSVGRLWRGRKEAGGQRLNTSSQPFSSSCKVLLPAFSSLL